MLQSGKETTVVAGGRKWTFGRLELSVISDYRDWVAGQLGDPFALAERFQGKLPPEEWLRLFKEAEATAKELESFSLGTALAQRFMRTERGGAKLAQLLLAKHHPDVTEDEAFGVLLGLEPAAFEQALKRGTGKVPAKNAAAPAA